MAPRFIDRLSYASNGPVKTAAAARRMGRPGEGAAAQHRFVNRIARRQRFMRVQSRRIAPAWDGTRSVG